MSILYNYTGRWEHSPFQMLIIGIDYGPRSMGQALIGHIAGKDPEEATSYRLLAFDAFDLNPKMVKGGNRFQCAIPQYLTLMRASNTWAPFLLANEEDHNHPIIKKLHVCIETQTGGAQNTKQERGFAMLQYGASAMFGFWLSITDNVRMQPKNAKWNTRRAAGVMGLSKPLSNAGTLNTWLKLKDRLKDNKIRVPGKRPNTTKQIKANKLDQIILCVAILIDQGITRALDAFSALEIKSRRDGTFPKPAEDVADAFSMAMEYCRRLMANEAKAHKRTQRTPAQIQAAEKRRVAAKKRAVAKRRSPPTKKIVKRRKLR